MGIKRKEGGEVSRAIYVEKNAKFETLPFGGASNVVIPKDFPPKLKEPGSFSIPCMSVE